MIFSNLSTSISLECIVKSKNLYIFFINLVTVSQLKVLSITVLLLQVHQFKIKLFILNIRLIIAKELKNCFIDKTRLNFLMNF